MLATEHKSGERKCVMSSVSSSKPVMVARKLLKQSRHVNVSEPESVQNMTYSAGPSWHVGKIPRAQFIKPFFVCFFQLYLNKSKASCEQGGTAHSTMTIALVSAVLVP